MKKVPVEKNRFRRRSYYQTKSIHINLNENIYGTFAEIGAGQEL